MLEELIREPQCVVAGGQALSVEPKRGLLLSTLGPSTGTQAETTAPPHTPDGESPE